MIAPAIAGARILGAAMDITLIPATLEAADSSAPAMDEQSFRLFYERTSRQLQAYLVAATSSPTVAEDLLQESYFRLIRSDVRVNDDNHRKNYLFRIATNLLKDRYRRRRFETAELVETRDSSDHEADVQRRTDFARVLRELTPRDRQLLWLAYVEGMSHHEIAAAVGLKSDSIRPLLFRARRRIAEVLRGKGMVP
jgi:RNA polymerase sigma-70 factor (ECF subfamily)